MGNFIEICCMKDWIARRLQELRVPAKVIPFPLKDENIYRLRNSQLDNKTEKRDEHIEVS